MLALTVNCKGLTITLLSNETYVTITFLERKIERLEKAIEREELEEKLRREMLIKRR